MTSAAKTLGTSSSPRGTGRATGSSADNRRLLTGAATELRLRDPEHRVHRRAMLLWAIRAVSDGLWFLVPLALCHFIFPGTRPWVDPIFGVIAVLVVVSAVVAPPWRYLVHRWEVSEEIVYARIGWITKSWHVVPVSRIQSVDVVAGPLDQLLGLATLKVRTAAKHAEIKLDGLSATAAADAAQLLSNTTVLSPGDAT